jgi:hypothetical protein
MLDTHSPNLPLVGALFRSPWPSISRSAWDATSASDSRIVQEVSVVER